MQQLDKKAVWLFFLGSFSKLYILVIMVHLWVLVVSVEDSFISSGENISGWGVLGFLPLLFIILSLFILILAFIWSKLTYHYYRYELGDIVFKKEHGVIYKKYVSIPYDRIQNVDIHRGILARLLGLSDLQIQTAGGITMSSYGAFSEGRLVGLSKGEAERLRDEVIRKAKTSRSGQGL